MLTYVITAVIIVAMMICFFKALWKVSKVLVIPIQIVLFLILSFVLCRIFFTKDNVKKIHDGIQKSGITEINEAALKKNLKAAEKVIHLPADSAEKTAAPKKRTSKVSSVAQEQKKANAAVPAAEVKVQSREVLEKPVAPAAAAPARQVPKAPPPARPVPKAAKGKSGDDDFFKMDIDSQF